MRSFKLFDALLIPNSSLHTQCTLNFHLSYHFDENIDFSTQKVKVFTLNLLHVSYENMTWCMRWMKPTAPIYQFACRCNSNRDKWQKVIIKSFNPLFVSKYLLILIRRDFNSIINMNHSSWIIIYYYYSLFLSLPSSLQRIFRSFPCLCSFLFMVEK